MSNATNAHQWQERITQELEVVRALLCRAGYTLDAVQPHLLGERFLMQNITTASGQKMILLGTDRNGTRVVIKAANEATGIAEIEHERACRTLLSSINFSYRPFHAPEELAYWTEDGYVISVQAFIEQSSPFIDRPLEDQFHYALAAFKTQESARATTSSHYNAIEHTFGIRTSSDYLSLVRNFLQTLDTLEVAEAVLATCQTALTRLEKDHDRIEQYCGFLTHTDFVPHNFRIHNETMYLLDCSSLEFGNKHESWARFLNFMTLYNYKLENHLLTYVEKNRAREERESLQLMRLYRLIEITTYYAKTVLQSEGDLQRLNQTRVHFWHDVLQAELQDQRVGRDTVERYRIDRDRLRSNEEKERQKGLH